MARRFDLLVFDWDGTLIDSAAHIVASLQAACCDLDLPAPAEPACRHVIGLGLQDAIRYILPGLPENVLDRPVERENDVSEFLSCAQREAKLPRLEGLRRQLGPLEQALRLTYLGFESVRRPAVGATSLLPECSAPLTGLAPPLAQEARELPSPCLCLRALGGGSGALCELSTSGRVSCCAITFTLGSL